MNSHVMVDLETLGTGSNAVIIAIGAVVFNPIPGVIGGEFYATIDPQSCVNLGLEMDADTVMWWMKQDEKARAAFAEPGRHLSAALLDLASWMPEDSCLWGNGATFDNVILNNAYQAAGLKQPWGKYADRCYRTLKNLKPEIKATRTGTHHNALDDAKTQAEHAIRLLRAVEGGAA